MLENINTSETISDADNHMLSRLSARVSRSIRRANAMRKLEIRQEWLRLKQAATEVWEDEPTIDSSIFIQNGKEN